MNIIKIISKLRCNKNDLVFITKILFILILITVIC